jgi:hypothetical protein
MSLWLKVFLVAAIILMIVVPGVYGNGIAISGGGSETAVGGKITTSIDPDYTITDSAGNQVSIHALIQNAVWDLSDPYAEAPSFVLLTPDLNPDGTIPTGSDANLFYRLDTGTATAEHIECSQIASTASDTASDGIQISSGSLRNYYGDALAYSYDGGTYAFVGQSFDSAHGKTIEINEHSENGYGITDQTININNGEIYGYGSLYTEASTPPPLTLYPEAFWASSACGAGYLQGASISCSHSASTVDDTSSGGLQLLHGGYIYNYLSGGQVGTDWDWSSVYSGPVQVGTFARAGQIFDSARGKTIETDEHDKNGDGSTLDQTISINTGEIDGYSASFDTIAQTLKSSYEPTYINGVFQSAYIEFLQGNQITITSTASSPEYGSASTTTLVHGKGATTPGIISGCTIGEVAGDDLGYYICYGGNIDNTISAQSGVSTNQYFDSIAGNAIDIVSSASDSAQHGVSASTQLKNGGIVGSENGADVLFGAQVVEDGTAYDLYYNDLNAGQIGEGQLIGSSLALSAQYMFAPGKKGTITQKKSISKPNVEPVYPSIAFQNNAVIYTSSGNPPDPHLIQLYNG